MTITNLDAVLYTIAFAIAMTGFCVIIAAGLISRALDRLSHHRESTARSGVGRSKRSTRV